MKPKMTAAEDLVLRAGVAQEPGGPPGGTGAFASAELESEDKSATTGIIKSEVAKVAQEINEPPGGVRALASVTFESEDKSTTPEILKTETAAGENLVLGAEVAQETGELWGFGVGRVAVRGQVGDPSGREDRDALRRGPGAEGRDGLGDGRVPGRGRGFGVC